MGAGAGSRSVVRRCTTGHDGHACRKIACPICGPSRLGDFSARISGNADALPKVVFMVTVTAPGWDDLRTWGQQLGAREPRNAEEADWQRILATVGEIEAWNASMLKRWSQMHRAAYAKAYRNHEGQSIKIGLKVVEPHRRGLLHVHLVVTGSPGAAQTYAEALSDRREAYGFGYVDRGTKKRADGSYGPRRLVPLSGVKAAKYLAKYVRKTMESKRSRQIVAGVQEQLRAGRKRAGGNVVYVGKGLTGRTGLTARWLRWKRVAWVYGACPYTGEIVAESEARTEALVKGEPMPRPPPEIEQMRALAWDQITAHRIMNRQLEEAGCAMVPRSYARALELAA